MKTFLSFVQPEKDKFSNLITFSEMQIDSKEEQPLNAQ